MPEEPSNTSIGNLTSYFGGTSPINFTTHWAHRAFSEGLMFQPTATWVYSLPHGSLRHEVSFDLGTESVPVEAARMEFLYRVLCHALVDRLPANALVDAAENLADVFRLHHQISLKARALPTPPRMQGRLGEQHQRKQLRFSEE